MKFPISKTTNLGENLPGYFRTISFFVLFFFWQGFTGAPAATVNSENNQFIGLNVHDWPTPPMFWKKDKILTGIVNVWPESWLWLVFHFHEGSLKHLLSLFLYLDMGHNKEMLGVSPISFNLVQQSHFGQITLTSLNQSFEVGAKTLYLADSILWIIKSQKVKSKN